MAWHKSGVDQKKGRENRKKHTRASHSGSEVRKRKGSLLTGRQCLIWTRDLIAARHRNGSQVFVTVHITIQEVEDASLGSSRGPNLILRPFLKSPGLYCNSKVVSDFSFDIGKLTKKTGGLLNDHPV